MDTGEETNYGQTNKGPPGDRSVFTMNGRQRPPGQSVAPYEDILTLDYGTGAGGITASRE